MTNPQFKIPRHLYALPEKQKRKQFSFTNEDSVILPNGVKLHAVATKGQPRSEAIEAYCQTEFGMTKNDVVSQIRMDAEQEIGAITAKISHSVSIELDDFLDLERRLKVWAEQSFLEARLQLGLLYLQHGLRHGHAESDGLGWLTKAAKGKHPDAATNLATYHLRHGRTAEAKGVLKKYQKSSNAQSRYLFARILRSEAEGLDDNADEAFSLFKAASKGGHPEATAEMVSMHMEYPDALRLHASPAELLQEAVDEGCTQAMYLLAEMYETGTFGVDQRLDDALTLYERGASNGCDLAQLAMGAILSDGPEGVFGRPGDPAAALYWYEAAFRNSKHPRIQRSAQQGIFMAGMASWLEEGRREAETLAQESGTAKGGCDNV